jgi:hypothetical protein
MSEQANHPNVGDFVLYRHRRDSGIMSWGTIKKFSPSLEHALIEEDHKPVRLSAWIAVSDIEEFWSGQTEPER